MLCASSTPPQAHVQSININIIKLKTNKIKEEKASIIIIEVMWECHLSICCFHWLINKEIAWPLIGQKIR